MFLGDILKGAGSIIGAVTGSVIGLSASVIATTLELPLSIVKEALNSGCTTYEEIRNFANRGY